MFWVLVLWNGFPLSFYTVWVDVCIIILCSPNYIHGTIIIYAVAKVLIMPNIKSHWRHRPRESKLKRTLYILELAHFFYTLCWYSNRNHYWPTECRVSMKKTNSWDVFLQSSVCSIHVIISTVLWCSYGKPCKIYQAQAMCAWWFLLILSLNVS